MSGSIKCIKYDDDYGNFWALRRDESNIENIMTNDAAVDIQEVDLIARKFEIPQNLEPRFAYYKSTSTVKVRKIVIPTLDIAQDLVLGTQALASRSFTDTQLDPPETFTFVSVKPEQIRPVVVSIDTGLNDGDAT